jgi:hypothetical protein
VQTCAWTYQEDYALGLRKSLVEAIELHGHLPMASVGLEVYRPRSFCVHSM